MFFSPHRCQLGATRKRKEELCVSGAREFRVGIRCAPLVVLNEVTIEKDRISDRRHQEVGVGQMSMSPTAGQIDHRIRSRIWVRRSCNGDGERNGLSIRVASVFEHNHTATLDRVVA